MVDRNPSREEAESDPRRIYVGRFERQKGPEGASRAGVVAFLGAHQHTVRCSIQEWLDREGLSEHVRLLPESKLVNILFFEADQEGGDRLREAPYLVDVAPDEDGGLIIEPLGATG